MTNPRTAAQRELRAWRAAMFALAVLAQLLVPAIVLRAQAIAGELCVAGSDGSSQGSSTGHAHDQQCAHCRLHNCSPLAPPSSAAIAIVRTVARPPAQAAPVFVSIHAGRAHPPPTGPPAR